MGMPAGKLTPSPEQGLAGGGGVPPSPTAGAQFRALKTGEAMQRLQAADKALDISAKLAEVGFVDEAAEIELDVVTITREAIASLVPPAPQPLPGPSGSEPIEPENRP